jgi:glucosamine-6-phosphate deaminase
MENKIIASNEAEFDAIAARMLIDSMRAPSRPVIGLATGRTTVRMYQLAAEIFTQNPFDISEITLFGVDEVTNIPRSYYGACYTLLKSQIIDALPLRDNQFLMPPTLSNDFDAECSRYESELEARGGIDFLILGIGTNGHLGFNQPGAPFSSKTWVSRMDPSLEARIRLETKAPDAQQLGGLTIGLKTIMHARKILLAAKGGDKANIVRAMLHGEITPDVPASILQLHPNCTFLLDPDAAKQLIL